MFTGIIQEIGTVENVYSHDEGGLGLRIKAPRSSPELHVGDSVSILGVCLTVVSKSGLAFDVLSVEETLKKTTLGTLGMGDAVNLELPIRLADRIGGHIVLGHVDAVGTIAGIETRESSHVFSFSFSPEFSRYVIPVGSIAVDGVSLTVAEAGDGEIRVSVIPHTMEMTVFKFRKEGDRVNLEFDVLGKYVERLLERWKFTSDEEKFLGERHLRELGF